MYKRRLVVKKTIPVVYASDDNFLKQTFVSIYSVLLNRINDYYLSFYIFIPEGCKEEKYDVNWAFKDYCIQYVHVSTDYFRDVNMVIQNITKPTFYRLLIPMFLKNIDSCIYLDGDTICCADISELFDVELGNNLLAASTGARITFNAEEISKILEIPSAKNYINAGVLLMNLSLMRNEEIVETFIKYSFAGFPCQDQDVLNKCCFGRIKMLPLKFNVYANVYSMPLTMLSDKFSVDELEDAVDRPVIIHYPREYSKPWKNKMCAKGKEWWNYASKALNNDILLDLEQETKKWEKQYSYQNLFDKVECSQKVVIFGFSEVGCSVCDEVDDRYPNRIIAFCDNDISKNGKTYKGHRVIDVEKLKRDYHDALVVITSQNYSKLIQEQLLEMGFLEDNLVIYRKKTLNYIYSFDKDYWEKMWKDIVIDDISTKECLKSGVNEIEKYVYSNLVGKE